MKSRTNRKYLHIHFHMKEKIFLRNTIAKERQQQI